MKPAVLKADGLAFGFEKNRLLFQNVSFEIGSGEIMVLLGPNGAGKTTLLNCLAGHLAPSAGTVFIFGRPAAAYARIELARKMAYVAQMQNAVLSHTVWDYLILGRAPHLKMAQMPGEKEHEKVHAVVHRLGIEHLVNRNYIRLSGGERQQVQIARALVQDCPIILLDEPTNHLDYGNQCRVLQLIDHLAAEGLAILMTSHMPDTPFLLNSQVGIIGTDGCFSVGAADELMKEDTLSQLYGLPVQIAYVETAGRKVCLYRFKADRH